MGVRSWWQSWGDAPPTEDRAAPPFPGLSVPDPVTWPGWPSTEWGWDTAWAGTDTVLGRSSIVFACVDLACRSLASMPLQHLDADARPADVRPWMRNPEPARYTAMGHAMREIVSCLLLRGEAFLGATVISEGTGRPLRWIVLNPDMVDIEGAHPGEATYTIGSTRLTPGVDLLHVRYESWPGLLHGVSPLQAAAANLSTSSRLEHYTSELATGAVPPAVLEVPHQLNAAQADDLRDRWMDARRSGGAAPAILSGGANFRPLTLSPADMALLELRTFDEQRIAALLGTPPFLVGLPQAEGLTYASSVQLLDFYWRATLRPMASTIGDALGGWVLPDRHTVVFDADAFNRPGLAERATALAQLVAAGIVTVDEARAQENLPPHDPDTAPPATEVEPTPTGPGEL